MLICLIEEDSQTMFARKKIIFHVIAVLLFPNLMIAQGKWVNSQFDPSLDYPVLVVEAEPYLRPGMNAGTKGNFKIVYKEIGTLPARRMRLPVPQSTWRLDGRVIRTRNGILYAGFGTYLYRSNDDGKTWIGRRIEGLPNTQQEPVSAQAFGGNHFYIYVCHQASGLPPLTSKLVTNPAVSAGRQKLYSLVISRSSDGGEHWEGSEPLVAPHPYKALTGDGNSIVALGDGSLLVALDAYDPEVSSELPGRSAQVFFQSKDQGLTWSKISLMQDTAAETGLVSLGGLQVLAAIRGIPNSRLGGKTIQLAESIDGGRSWFNFRSLTRVFGQAHATLALLPGGGIVATYENRYPYAEGGDVRARISWDMGKSWAPEVYILMKGHGYGSSVAGNDGTIITVAGDGKLGLNGQPTGRGYTLQAMRWRPWEKTKWSNNR